MKSRPVRTEARHQTGIEWTTATWNPFVGCSIHTPGCTNCYAMRQAARIERMAHAPYYAGTTRIANGHPIWTGKLARASDDQVRKPLTIRSPARIFVNSMSDFFHEGALDEWRLEALAIMRATPRHSYQVLTKRPEEIRPFLDRAGAELPANVWLGATVERGDFAHRIDTLRAVAAAIRFRSIEPLIGPIGELDLSGIHWVIVGGESGPGARRMAREWLAGVIDQCRAQHVALFFKQWGIPQNNPLWAEAVTLGFPPATYVAERDPVGKGGSRYLGREIKQYPTRRPLRG
ncbi:MAG: phage Gp37/Gp68 family protein [Steroidobacteraceae bacterium]